MSLVQFFFFTWEILMWILVSRKWEFQERARSFNLLMSHCTLVREHWLILDYVTDCVHTLTVVLQILQKCTPVAPYCTTKISLLPKWLWCEKKFICQLSVVSEPSITMSSGLCVTCIWTTIERIATMEPMEHQCIATVTWSSYSLNWQITSYNFSYSIPSN